MNHILGIRHHGPGSARNVKAFLEAVKPDIVLVEGPPEADELLRWVGDEGLQPPVAILLYQADALQRSVFYPFAEFSPEWQAMLYARQHNIPVRFMDLPVAHTFGLQAQEGQSPAAAIAAEAPAGAEEDMELPGDTALPAVEVPAEEDVYGAAPLRWMARAGGHADSDKWWEHTFENRVSNEQVFEAVTEMMQAAREHRPVKDRHEQLREAWMRKTIRQAQKELYTEVAVICGAWHVPALTQMPPQKEDNELLKGLPKVKVECTWIPWTYSRLSFASGYGAGINSPGWYSHLWHYPEDDGTRWMAGVARLLREKQMDTSVAHIIESVRLAHSLAALRGLSRAGLEELNEATLSVVCHGEPLLMQLIKEELIVSNRIGSLPTGIPKPPLQADIEKQQKKLRLPATAEWKEYTLDLRKDTDLERSVLLHRLQLLGIHWGKPSEVSGKGTFKEQWRLQWAPELAIDIIDKGNWGNTVEAAATAFVQHQATVAASLQVLCTLLQQALPAELPQAVEALIQQVTNQSAATGDVMQLMQLIGPLVTISRYGNVRKTDAALVTDIVTGMITRVCISLPGACTGIAEDAAQKMLALFLEMNNAVSVLQHSESTAEWQQTLQRIAGSSATHPVIAGYSTRLLADYKLLEGEALVKVFYSALSPAVAPALAAAWIEGFLKGSGTLLLLDADLWRVVNDWVKQLPEESFIQVLPLLRRTFSHFTTPERRKLGEKVRQGDAGAGSRVPEQTTDEARGRQALPVIMQLLGYPALYNKTDTE